jgi:hypothetical protein
MAANVIIGISAGTRIVGVAIIKKGELLDWRVKSYKAQWSKAKENAIIETISKLCDYYHADSLAIKETDPLRSSLPVEHLQKAIKGLAKSKRLTLASYSLADLNYARRKKQLSEDIVEKYPELRSEYKRECNNKREYYARMFEAAAIAEKLWNS